MQLRLLHVLAALCLLTLGILGPGSGCTSDVSTSLEGLEFCRLLG